jgi:HAD superfamily phosphoserine phosphatase-like hydrolase
MELKNTIFIFDVDSTLIKGESLDDIIEIAISSSDKKDNSMKNIRRITRLGMEGQLDFKESLEKRFEVVQILQEHINLFNKRVLPSQIDQGFKKVIKTIRKKGGQIFIVSGGFMESVLLVADELNIDRDKCFANNFVKKGDNITGFNKSNPLSKSNGKVRVVQKIKDDNKGRQIICIGDGSSDYLIRKEEVADEFWGFWGNVKRKNIEAKADRNFYNSEELFKFVHSLE